jgi:hypothetical protein
VNKQRVTPTQISYAVLWRDRNASVLLYFTSGSRERPEVTLDTALDLAAQQQMLLAAGLESNE